jgi:chromosome segregation protein
MGRDSEPSALSEVAAATEQAIAVAEALASEEAAAAREAAAIQADLEAQGNGFALRLRRMEIAGFKSFSDRTEIRFPDGITAVVGPNGCGKSNIGDAINWVLGAQSAKLLRGNSMQDVIFNGTEARRPMGMAEVSIHLVGTRASDPNERRDVVITRRLFRDGESEYLLNGSRARLKDIQEILRRAHVGAKTYATIEQGQIDQILNSKPRDRRLIIEDAAGVSGFKHKRRLAELKLQATEANLLRVNDIVSEVRRQINSLKRQAAKARRYQRLRERLRARKRMKFAVNAWAMDAALADVKRAEATARGIEAEAGARLAALEAEVASERQSLEEADHDFRETARRFHQLEAEVDRKNERVQHCRERIAEAEETARRLAVERKSLEERRAAAEVEIGTLDQRVRSGAEALEAAGARAADKQAGLESAAGTLDGLRQGHDGLRRELFEALNRAAERRNARRSAEDAVERAEQTRQRLLLERETTLAEERRLATQAGLLAGETEAARAGVARLRGEAESAEQAVRDARAEISEEGEKLASAREREKSAAARLRTLEDIATRFAGVSDGVRLLLTSGRSSGVRPLGVVADFVEAGSRFEGAVEYYLQALLPTVVLENDADAARAAALLRHQGAGRTSLISRTQPAGSPAVGCKGNGHGVLPEALFDDPRVLGRLRDHLQLKSHANGFVEDRIGDAVVVDKLETALALHRLHPRSDYLTPEGDVVYASGVVTAGGGQGSGQGLLAHTRKTREARTQLATATAEAEALSERVESRRAEIERLERLPVEHRQALDEAQRRAVETEIASRQNEDERRRCRRRLEILSQEIEGLAAEAHRAASDLEEATRAVEDAEAAHRAVEQRLEAASDEMHAADHGLRALAEEVAAAREELAAERQRHQALATQREQLRAALGEWSRRIEQAVRDLESCDRRAREAAEIKARTEHELAAELDLRESRAAEVSERERSMDVRRRQLLDREGRVRDLRGELETRRQETGAAEIRLAGADADRRHLDDLCAQELGITATEAAATTEMPSEPIVLADLDAEIEDLVLRVEAVGPVNMTAIEEFSGLEERYAFLTTQRKDLMEAMESLKETIRRINRSSRERFNEAFEAIRRNYQEIFQSLFNGGRADLRLEEGEDVLECGIEIMAQPPGKRLGNVLLLSGGEKAMSAIALLFAIFRHQPSPFCLLDEVDAALDDVNVGRFTRMLKVYAHENQFIIITHNKLSMDSANLLYGVTMEEPGVSKLVSLQLS